MTTPFPYWGIPIPQTLEESIALWKILDKPTPEQQRAMWKEGQKIIALAEGEKHG